MTGEQIARLESHFPQSHGRPRADGRRVLSGIIFVSRNGMRQRIWAAQDALQSLEAIGGMNTKLHAGTGANGRTLSFFITAGQIGDYIGAWLRCSKNCQTHNGGSPTGDMMPIAQGRA